MSALFRTGTLFTLGVVVEILFDESELKKLPMVLSKGLEAERRFSSLFLRSKGIQDSNEGIPSPPDDIEAWKKPRGVSAGRRSHDLMALRICLSRDLRVCLWIIPKINV